ncbi:hypothetical protein V2J09_022845 [Rumex salicifolius]
MHQLLLLPSLSSSIFPCNSKPTQLHPRRLLLTCHLPLGFEDITSIAHNKVLVAAAASTAVGQLSKPFTSAFLYRRSFDFKAVVQSGGFPSTHSSVISLSFVGLFPFKNAVVAAATSLALERGFSDSIFGLTVVYAALVMYDSQGVRREVGKHAKTINKVLLESRKSTAEEESISGKTTETVQGLENSSKSDSYLYERVGHTEVEVLAGALLGVVVSLTVSALT